MTHCAEAFQEKQRAGGVDSVGGCSFLVGWLSTFPSRFSFSPPR